MVVVIETVHHMIILIITSRVSGQGNVFGPVRPAVLLSVCLWTLSRPNRLTYGHENWLRGVWVLEGLSGKNSDKEGTTQEGRQHSGVFTCYSIVYPKAVVYQTHHNSPAAGGKVEKVKNVVYVHSWSWPLWSIIHRIKVCYYISGLYIVVTTLHCRYHPPTNSMHQVKV